MIQCNTDLPMEPLIPKAKIEKLLEEKKHPEKRGMVNVYICRNCSHRIMFVYFDTGVTPFTMKCSNCGKMTAESCMVSGDQPDSIWYRPNDISELKQIVEDAYKYNENDYKKMSKEQGLSKKEIKEIILRNYIKHYNQGGLFGRARP